MPALAAGEHTPGLWDPCWEHRACCVSVPEAPSVLKPQCQQAPGSQMHPIAVACAPAVSCAHVTAYPWVCRWVPYIILLATQDRKFREVGLVHSRAPCRDIIHGQQTVCGHCLCLGTAATCAWDTGACSKDSWAQRGVGAGPNFPACCNNTWS